MIKSCLQNESESPTANHFWLAQQMRNTHALAGYQLCGFVQDGCKRYQLACNRYQILWKCNYLPFYHDEQTSKGNKTLWTRASQTVLKIEDIFFHYLQWYDWSGLAFLSWFWQFTWDQLLWFPVASQQIPIGSTFATFVKSWDVFHKEITFCF